MNEFAAFCTFIIYLALFLIGVGSLFFWLLSF
jgi:hypothetical protein